jgi:hypothetical protein
MGTQYLKIWSSVVVIVNTRESKPYRMQSLLQLFFSALASNKFLQNFEFLRATRLDSTRIVKNITVMVGEYKLVVDPMFASLALCLGSPEEKYHCH